MMKVDVKKIAVKYCSDVADTTSIVDKAYIQPSLLAWYKDKRRMLPWRGDMTCIPRSAYGTWISEVMLQQTRVETVIEYWNRWMAVFPDVKTLAIATPDEVNKMWAGLGYYRRAQMLLKGAIKVVEDYDGVLPDTTQELLKIPGIGPYTAGAIASIAYDKAEPLVDGNVMRVFSRLLAMKLEVGGGAMEKQCWKVAAELVPAESPGDFNQALMELGATVCKPTSPDCASCPLSSVCHAKILSDHAKSLDSVRSAAPASTAKSAAAGMLELFTKKRRTTQDDGDIEDVEPAGASLSHEELGYDLSLLPRNVAEFPRKVAKKKAKELTFSVCVLRTKSLIDAAEYADKKPEYRYLFVRRPATGLLANQWEFPSVGITPEVEEPGEVDKGETSMVVSAAELWAPFPAYFVENLRMRWQACGTEIDSCSGQVGAEDESREEAVLLETHVNHAFEPILHIFSHQRHTMHISLRDVQVVSRTATASPAATVTPTQVAYKWMTAAEIVEAGITTGCKKILTQVTKTATVGTFKTKADNNHSTSSGTGAAKELRKYAPKVKKEEASHADQGNGHDDAIVVLDEDDGKVDTAMAKGPVNAFDLMKKASTKPVAPANKRAKK